MSKGKTLTTSQLLEHRFHKYKDNKYCKWYWKGNELLFTLDYDAKTNTIEYVIHSDAYKEAIEDIRRDIEAVKGR